MGQQSKEAISKVEAEEKNNNNINIYRNPTKSHN